MGEEPSSSRSSCRVASGGALRTSLIRSWRGGGDPDWHSAPQTWWGCRKRGRGPGSWERCYIQSPWRCWGSPGAPPAASSRVRSARWRRASSCGEKGCKEEEEHKGVSGCRVFVALPSAVIISEQRSHLSESEDLFLVKLKIFIFCENTISEGRMCNGFKCTVIQFPFYAKTCQG